MEENNKTPMEENNKTPMGYKDKITEVLLLGLVLFVLCIIFIAQCMKIRSVLSALGEDIPDTGVQFEKTIEEEPAAPVGEWYLPEGETLSGAEFLEGNTITLGANLCGDVELSAKTDGEEYTLTLQDDDMAFTLWTSAGTLYCLLSTEESGDILQICSSEGLEEIPELYDGMWEALSLFPLGDEYVKTGTARSAELTAYSNRMYMNVEGEIAPPRNYCILNINGDGDVIYADWYQDGVTDTGCISASVKDRNYPARSTTGYRESPEEVCRCIGIFQDKLQEIKNYGKELSEDGEIKQG